MVVDATFKYTQGKDDNGDIETLGITIVRQKSVKGRCNVLDGDGKTVKCDKKR